MDECHNLGSHGFPQGPPDTTSKVLRMLPLKLNDTHSGTSPNPAVTQDFHTLSPCMFSPQGGSTVDHRDSPADVGVRRQLSDPWVLVKPFHSLLEASRREGNGHRWYTLLLRVPCGHPAYQLKQILLPSVSDPPILISNHPPQVLEIEPKILTC